MCGIFGFAKKEESLNAVEQNQLRGMVMDLTFRNEERGSDGTGLALFSGDQMILFKEALSAGKLFKTERFRKVIRSITSQTRICLGHTRLATIGEVGDKHCHPFVTDEFVGVHNGHFMNRRLLLEKYKKSVQTPVDSEAIFRVLDGGSGHAEIISRLEEMEGDFAIGFVRKAFPCKLHLVRNCHKPLHVAYIRKLKTLFWSSQKDHLEFALARNDLRAGVWEIKEDFLYTADTNLFNGKSNLMKARCKISEFDWEAFDDGNRRAYGRTPNLVSFKDFHTSGLLEGVQLSERSRIPCSFCGMAAPAGELYFEEMSGQFLCDRCSVDYFDDYDAYYAPSIPRGQTGDLFEKAI